MGTTYRMKDPRGLGVAVQLLLGLDIVTSLLGVATRLATDFNEQSALVGLTDLLEFGVFVVAGVVILCWIYRVSANAHLLATGLTISPGWAVGWFFIPIAWLWKPFQGVSEAWRASTGPDTDWKAAPVPGLLRWWWGFWLVQGILGNVALRLAQIPEAGVAASFINIASSLADGVTCVLLIVIVRRLSGMQVRAMEHHAFA